MAAARPEPLHSRSRRRTHHTVVRQSAVVIASQGAKFHRVPLWGMLSRIVLTFCEGSSWLASPLWLRALLWTRMNKMFCFAISPPVAGGFVKRHPRIAATFLDHLQLFQVARENFI
jgi:hypothetical protein